MEYCDDGNVVSNDGCSSTCALEPLAGWSCQRRSDISGVVAVNTSVSGGGVVSYCLTSAEAAAVAAVSLSEPRYRCTASMCSRCGNGIVEGSEQCDEPGATLMCPYGQMSCTVRYCLCNSMWCSPGYSGVILTGLAVSIRHHSRPHVTRVRLHQGSIALFAID